LRITNVRVYEVSRYVEHQEPFWEERQCRPVDIYPECDAEPFNEWNVERVSSKLYKVKGHYLEIETDEGLRGIFGPLGAPVGDIEAFIILRRLKRILVGSDPFEREKLWDKMYRYLVHGRKGYSMMAISSVDCALWDLIGKALKTPVYRLLGGPTRTEIPAYASMLGHSLDPEMVSKRCEELVEAGFKSMKWFLRYGPKHGLSGFEKNLNLVKTIRDTVGYGIDLMVDAWMGWNVDYAFKMACSLDKYEVKWIEEPLLPDDLEGYVRLKRRMNRSGLHVLLAGGEHEYTRWGFLQLLRAGALDIIQPDIAWAGGITETLKICALASSYGIQVIPHTKSVPLTLHLAFSRPSWEIPIAEYLIKWNVVNQAPLKVKHLPEKGVFKPPETPGLGLELDESKVQRREFRVER